MLDSYVRPEWIDCNGHMTDSRYLQVFGDATDALFRWAGIDEAHRKTGRAMYTLESHVRHIAEAKALEPLYVTTQMLDLDTKRVRLYHFLHRSRDEALVAGAEQLYVHVDTQERHAAPMPSSVHDRLQRLRAAHAGLPAPGGSTTRALAAGKS
jgi:carnitine 3-dehydrogenase